MRHLKSITSSVGVGAGAALAGLATLASLGILAPAAYAGTGTVTPTITASGTPDISATVRTVVTTDGLIDLHFSVTQPANICRLESGDCPAGYPNWQADLTISGYAAAGLTYDKANGGFACTESSGLLTCHNDYLNNYFKTFDVYFTPSEGYGGDVTADLVVSDKTVTDAPPTTTAQCKKDGWATFNTLSFQPATVGSTSGYLPVFTPRFDNQGRCVSSVVSNGHSTS